MSDDLDIPPPPGGRIAVRVQPPQTAATYVVMTTRPAELRRHDISDEQLEMLVATNHDGVSEAFWGCLGGGLGALLAVAEPLWNVYLAEPGGVGPAFTHATTSNRTFNCCGRIGRSFYITDRFLATATGRQRYRDRNSIAASGRIKSSTSRRVKNPNWSHLRPHTDSIPNINYRQTVVSINLMIDESESHPCKKGTQKIQQGFIEPFAHLPLFPCLLVIVEFKDGHWSMTRSWARALLAYLRGAVRLRGCPYLEHPPAPAELM
jgi:hypothetical protein